MIIDTRSKETLQKSICEYFRIDLGQLPQLLIEFEETNNFDEFLAKYPTYRSLDNMQFFHLARRLSEDRSKYGMDLHTVLTTNTAIKIFMERYGISFEREGTKLNMFFHKENVNIEKCNDIAARRSLQKKFGKNGLDTCFNGLAFYDNIEESTYYERLSSYPEAFGEIMTVIDSVYPRSEFSGAAIIREFKKNSNYYCYMYEIPISEVIFDGNGFNDVSIKQKAVLHLALRKLHKYILGKTRQPMGANGIYRKEDECQWNYYIRLIDGKNIDGYYCKDEVLLRH